MKNLNGRLSMQNIRTVWIGCWLMYSCEFCSRIQYDYYYCLVKLCREIQWDHRSMVKFCRGIHWDHRSMPYFCREIQWDHRSGSGIHAHVWLLALPAHTGAAQAVHRTPARHGAASRAGPRVTDDVIVGTLRPPSVSYAPLSGDTPLVIATKCIKLFFKIFWIFLQPDITKCFQCIS